MIQSGDRMRSSVFIRWAHVVPLVAWTPLLLVNALCCWWLYAFARVNLFLPDAFVLLRIASFVTGLSFVWTVAIAAVPLCIVRYRQRVRFERFCGRRCTRCNYSLVGLKPDVCPECGAAVVEMHEPPLRWRRMAGATVVLLGTSLLVMAATELRMRGEERDFDSRVNASDGTVHLYAARAWPNEDAGMAYIPGYGLSLHD